MSDLTAYFAPLLPRMTDLLTTLVEHESFTPEKAHVDRLGAYLLEHLRAMGADVSTLPQAAVGDFVLAKWNADAPEKPILILCHMDTVKPIGTLEKEPIRTADDGRMYGPGIVDMKGGIVAAFTAIEGLLARGELPAQRPLWLLITSDEEIGSVQSEPVITALAQQAALALVTEPPTADGALKTGRKGVATYEIEVLGKASHAGNHPEAGVNAILEMAQQIQKIHRLQDLRNGISVAATLIQGGSATNVIPDYAKVSVDVRTFTHREMDQVHEALMNLYPHIPGADVHVHLHHRRGPMERNALMEATFTQCKAIAAAHGLTVREATVGGGSDGNITASLGIPTLDGLGPQGGGMHATDEHVVVRSLPQSAALLAALIRDWQP